MTVTILELALHRGAQPDENGGVNGAEFERVGLSIMGGCEVCGASLAAYNGCPSKSGFWRCKNGCIDDAGWDDVAECDRALFPPTIKVGDVVHVEGASALAGDVIALLDDGQVAVRWRETSTVEHVDDLVVHDGGESDE